MLGNHFALVVVHSRPQAYALLAYRNLWKTLIYPGTFYGLTGKDIKDATNHLSFNGLPDQTDACRSFSGRDEPGGAVGGLGGGAYAALSSCRHGQAED
jgi:hypothetical protein